jgi:sugar phosphate isomerase/epimerase
MRSRAFILGCCLAVLMACHSRVAVPADDRIYWKHVSSATGELPNPGGSHQQTAALAVNLDKGKATGFVIGYRVSGPALVWMRPTKSGWTRLVIEPEFLTIEAGGAAYDIDGDGDLDLVFGQDLHGNHLWWWENPYPRFDPKVPWKRHVIKSSGANQHHDEIFADIEGKGRPQLVFWNQGAKTLFLAEIPPDPRKAESWPLRAIYQGAGEGLDAADIDGDGQVDLLAGNCWFKRRPDGQFQAIPVGPLGRRIRAGRFKAGKTAQIVMGPGDEVGPLRFYEPDGDPTDARLWRGRDLIDRKLNHGHTLEVGDIDGDGNLDIFAAEMAKWSNKPEVDNPKATAWILYGDGKGGFAARTLPGGQDFHDARLADLDGDGDLDILDKPYTWNAPRVDVWWNGGGSSLSAKAKAPFRHPAGMELWTYRREAEKDLPGTLKTIRDLGFTDIETASFYGRTAPEFRRMLDRAGLTCTSLISTPTELRSGFAGVVSDAKTVGAKYVIVATIQRKGVLTAEEVDRAAAEFNEFGTMLKALGLRLGYHPHGFEFVRTPEGNLFDRLLAQTRPDAVTYELDVFWMAHGGGDPVRYLDENPGRFELLHLKDLAKGTPTGVPTGKAPDEASVAVGSGTLDWKRILDAAQRAGVKYYYIEDESPRAAVQVPQSVAYLKKIGF